MTLVPSPVPVQTTIGQFPNFEPSALTWVLGACTVVAVIVYTVQLLRVPKGRFWDADFRHEPFVNPRLAAGSMIAMLVFGGASMLSSKHDSVTHEAAIARQEAHDAAVQAEVKAALSDYYGVEFPDEWDRIWSYEFLNSYDHLPGDQVAMRLPDGRLADDCYVGDTGGFYVISCGPRDAAVPLQPAL